MSARTIQLILDARDAGASRQIGQMRSGIQGVQADLKGMQAWALKAASALGLVFGAREVLGGLLSVNREYERFLAQLKTTEGSTNAAKGAFAFVEEFASSTPFQIEELVESFVTLRSMGIAPTEDMMTSFGNTASAWNAKITEYAEAVRGVLTGEAERLKQFGIVARMQGEQIAFTFKGQTTVVKRETEAILGYLQELADANFAGAMEEQMDTFNGIVSNTLDNIATIARTIGEGGLMDTLKEGGRWLRDFTGDLAANKTEVAAWTNVSLKAAKFALDTFLALPRILFNVVQGLPGLFTAANSGLIWVFEFAMNQVIKLINWAIEQLNRLPFIDIDFRLNERDPDKWLNLMKGGLQDVWDEAKDGYKVIDELAQSWVDLAVAAEYATQVQATAARVGGAPPKPGAPATPSTPGGLPVGYQNVLPSLLDGPVEMSDRNQRKLDADLAARNKRLQAQREFAESIIRDLESSAIGMAYAIGDGIALAFQGSDNWFAGLGKGLRSILGDMMISAGTMIVTTSQAFAALQSALVGLQPWVGITAGLGLIAAGAAMKAWAAGGGVGATGGGGGGGRGMSDFRQSVGSPSQGGRVTVVLEGGPIYNMADYRQRESFKRAIKEIAGTGEVEFVGG